MLGDFTYFVFLSSKSCLITVLSCNIYWRIVDRPSKSVQGADIVLISDCMS